MLKFASKPASRRPTAGLTLSIVGRRSKLSAFPMTYTARATLEIGSGSVGSGRAVTTTTASNQVSTPRPPRSRPPRAPPAAHKVSGGETKPRGPEDRKDNTRNDKNKSEKSASKKTDNGEHKITVLKRGTELKTVMETQNVVTAKNVEAIADISENDRNSKSNSSENPKESGKKSKNRNRKHRSRSNNASENKDSANSVKSDAQEKSIPYNSESSNAKKKHKKSKRNKSTPRVPSAPEQQYDLKWYQAEMEASNAYCDAQSEHLYHPEVLNANRPPTCGPPEKIFKTTTRSPKHKLYPQMTLNSPERTRPIIYFENSKLGCSLRNRASVLDTNSNSNNHSRSKDFKSNHSKFVDESTPLLSSGSESDILKRINSKNIVPSSLVSVNPTNVRPMTIGSPVRILSGDNEDKANDSDKIAKDNNNVPNFTAGAGDSKSQITAGPTPSDKEEPRHDILQVSKSPEMFNVAVQNAEVKIEIHENLDSSMGGSLNESTNSESQQIYTLVENNGTVQYIQPQGVFQMSDENSQPISGIYCIELNDIAPNQSAAGGDSKNLAYFADQVQLFEVMKNANETNVDNKIESICDKEQSGCEETTCDNKPTSSNDDQTHSAASQVVNVETIGKEISKVGEAVDSVSDPSRAVADLSSVQQSSLREFFNNVYYFLTLPEGLLTPNVTSIKESASQKILELSNRANEKKAEQTELENKEKQEEATVNKSKKSKKNKKARLKDASEKSPEGGATNNQVGLPLRCSRTTFYTAPMLQILYSLLYFLLTNWLFL